MPSSKRRSDSSSGSSSDSRRLTIASSWLNAFSNSFGLRAIRPDSLQSHRLRVNGAFETTLLELHLDRIADLDRVRVENRFAAVAHARERDRVAAREHRQRRDGLEMRGDRFERA